ncbi:MAG: glucokinase [Myxococcota bacterium]|nr:glucokinase [Myxococcota bacterium]
MRLIVGDVGGSNCRLATYAASSIQNVWISPTKESGGLAQAIKSYTELYGADFDAGCVAVAGPVKSNEAVLTNVDWYGSASDFPCPGTIVNDLEAAAFGVQTLVASDKVVLQEAPKSQGTKAVIGIGTGHGLAWLFDGKVFPTESGHAEYAPPNSELRTFAAQFVQKHGRIRIEDVVSGIGIGNLLDYAIGLYGGEPPPSDIPAGAYVLRNAASDQACEAVLDWFALSTGSVIGDVITRSLATQIWLCGGVAQKWGAVLQRPSFREGLYSKSPMNHLIEQCQITLSLHPQLGLLGAASIAEALCTPS